ncbi:hypothetical protein ACOMHN_001486 [Nucella lapillus]
MSFFGKKIKDKDKTREAKEKDPGGKKSQFYVEFLGWMECRGLRGHRYTEPAVQELKRRQKKMDHPPKLTIQLTPKELRITQDFEEKRKRGIKKVTFPPIPSRDVTYAVQATRGSSSENGNRLDDVVACIFLGYMPRTGKYVHVHVYRFDEPSTASTFVKLMNVLVAANLNRINDVERDLAERGEIEDPAGLPSSLSDGVSEHATTGTDSAAGSVSGSGGYSDNGSPTFGSDDMDADLQSLNDVQPFDCVAEELKARLKMGGDRPLLLPPKDYDTISRARGNLVDINQRRCFNLSVVGEGGAAADQRPRNGSEESGIDLASPGSDNGDVLSRFPPTANQPAAGDVIPARTSQEGDFVYPPRHDRGGGGGYYPRSPAMSPALQRAQQHAQQNYSPRHSPQHSPFGTRSSRHSHHSDGNVSADRFPVYSRSNSNGSSNNVNAPFVNVVHPSYGEMGVGEEEEEEDEYVPPTDYDDEPVQMRRQPFFPPTHRPHSGNPLGGSPMLMRSLPAKVIQSDMALHSARSSRRPAEGGDEYFFSAQRRSQPVYASHNLLDTRPHSSDLAAHGPRRVNSYR